MPKAKAVSFMELRTAIWRAQSLCKMIESHAREIVGEDEGMDITNTSEAARELLEKAHAEIDAIEAGKQSGGARDAES